MTVSYVSIALIFTVIELHYVATNLFYSVIIDQGVMVRVLDIITL